MKRETEGAAVIGAGSQSSAVSTIASTICRGELVKRWLSFAGVGENSIATYQKSLKQLFGYLADKGIVQPARADLEVWRDSLIDSGKSASTINLYLSACKQFFRFLSQEGIYPNIADNLKSRVKASRDNHKKDALTEKQAQDLQRAVEGDNEKALRDSAIIALMLATGVRSVEVVRANFCDIRQQGGEMYLYVQGKGRHDKAECVLLPKKVYKKINQYLKVRGKINKNAPLFSSTARRNSGGRLQTQTISRLVKGKLRQIGLDSPTLTCHSLRHTAATVMLKMKQSLENVQMVLRHKSITTTMIYNNFINRQKNRAENVAATVLII